MLPIPGFIDGPLLGARIHYIGLFAPAQRMMARSGTVGLIDVVGLKHDNSHNPQPPYDYISHLIDCRSYGGFSGSLCFLEYSFASLDRLAILPDSLYSDDERPPVSPTFYLSVPCGMFTEHYTDEDEPKLNPDRAVSRYGVGVMLRGNEIKEALMTDKMREKHRERDAEALARAAATPSPGIRGASATTEAPEFTEVGFQEALRRATRIVTPDESAPEG